MKTTMEKPITAQQLKALHASFAHAGMDDEERHDFIREFTSGRTSSTKELTKNEAYNLLSAFNDRARRKHTEEVKVTLKAIYMLSLNISWLNAPYKNDRSQEAYEMNKAKINAFCKERAKAHKPVSKMNLEELKDVKLQLEAIARKETKQ